MTLIERDFRAYHDGITADPQQLKLLRIAWQGGACNALKRALEPTTDIEALFDAAKEEFAKLLPVLDEATVTLNESSSGSAAS